MFKSWEDLVCCQGCLPCASIWTFRCYRGFSGSLRRVYRRQRLGRYEILSRLARIRKSEWAGYVQKQRHNFGVDRETDRHIGVERERKREKARVGERASEREREIEGERERTLWRNSMGKWLPIEVCSCCKLLASFPRLSFSLPSMLLKVKKKIVLDL